MGQGFYFSRPVPPEEIIALSYGGLPVAQAAT
jgi:EAL domain-containing protein (putative c-di-GMP-specific phosphodiesterase class I)